MDIITGILVGISLAMDCATISIAGGANARNRRGSQKIEAALIAAVFFGFFQAAMLLVGGIGGNALKTAVSGIDHWIAFGLLGFIGLKMIVGSFKGEEESGIDLFDLRIMILLAIATSIDALVVGAALAFGDGTIAIDSIVVGLTTAVISFLAVLAGINSPNLFGRKIETVGGIILLFIGTRILLNHLGIIAF
jgi:putative Mn2+ efflux pump MntP